jgi:competence protein ComGC
MKRYVLLILSILVVMILVNYARNIKQQHHIKGLNARVDSLQNVIYIYESRQVQVEKNLNLLAKTTLDSLNLTLKANDSAIFSHDQQIRWLQWHVERLKK